MSEVITIAIAILALIVSILVLVIQYINQRERRYGEISQLRSEQLIKLSLIQQQLKSLRLHAETVRIELREVPDSDEKYESIEIFPKITKLLQEAEDSLKNTISTIESVNKKMNNSKSLFILQESQHDIADIERRVDISEKNMLSFLEMVRSRKNPSDDSNIKEPNE